jgi:exportin-2 (importin alpha re-exporter)
VFLPGIFDFCFKRKKTMKFNRNFITFFSLFVGKHGGPVVMSVIDALQPGLAAMVLNNIVLPNLQKVHGLVERKICAVGLTRLLLDTPAFLTGDYAAIWPKLLGAAILVLLSVLSI